MHDRPFKSCAHCKCAVGVKARAISGDVDKSLDIVCRNVRVSTMDCPYFKMRNQRLITHQAPLAKSYWTRQPSFNLLNTANLCNTFCLPVYPHKKQQSVRSLDDDHSMLPSTARVYKSGCWMNHRLVKTKFWSDTPDVDSIIALLLSETSLGN